MQSVSFPALARLQAIANDEAALFAHLLTVGVRFDARAKLADASDYSFHAKGSTLAVPTKAQGTSYQAERLAAFAGRVAGTKGLPALRLQPTEDLRPGKEGRRRIAVLAGDTFACLGFVQDKHTGWLLPLLDVEASPVRAFALAVTGGTAEKPTRGLNFLLTGCAEAVRLLYGPHGGQPEDGDNALALANHYAAEAQAEAEREAYESGSVARVEATMDAGASAPAAPARLRDARGRFLPATGSPSGDGAATGEPVVIETALDAARRRHPNAWELETEDENGGTLTVIYDGGREEGGWYLDVVEVYDADGADVTALHAEAGEAAIMADVRRSQEAAAEALADAF